MTTLLCFAPVRLTLSTRSLAEIPEGLSQTGPILLFSEASLSSVTGASSDQRIQAQAMVSSPLDERTSSRKTSGWDSVLPSFSAPQSLPTFSSLPSHSLSTASLKNACIAIDSVSKKKMLFPGLLNADDAQFAYFPSEGTVSVLRASSDPWRPLLFPIEGEALSSTEQLTTSLFFCSLYQWYRHLSSSVDQLRGAMSVLAQRNCPFPPLLKAINTFESAVSFAEVLLMPAWQLWILRDYILSALRSILPELLSDDVLPFKMNLGIAKLVYDSEFEKRSQDTIALALNPPTETLHTTLFEQRTLEYLPFMEQELLGEDCLSAFNLVPRELFCPITSENAIVVQLSKHSLTGENLYVCHVVVKSESREDIIFSPVMQRQPTIGFTYSDSQAFAAAHVAKGKIIDLLSNVADSKTLKELDMSFTLPETKYDDSVTQLDVIVMDCSGSMSAQAFDDDPVTRRHDAAQMLFNALIDKYRAMEVQGRVACVLFGSEVRLACPFTGDLKQFEELMGRAEVLGQTRLWDAVGKGLEEIVKERKVLTQQGRLSPDCRARIIAMTDGQDNYSTLRLVQVARHCRTNKVMFDAFVLGSVDDLDLHACASATGGFILSFRGIEDATELFEMPVVVNLSLRLLSTDLPPIGPSRESMRIFDDLIRFPRITSSVLRTTARTSNANWPNSSIHQSMAPRIPKVPASGSDPRQSSGTISTDNLGTRQQKRLQRDISSVMADGFREGIVAIDSSMMPTIKLMFRGVAGSVYENAVIVVNLDVPANYPFRGCKVRFESNIFHPQVSDTQICEEQFQSSWNPSNNIYTVVRTLRALLISPNINNAINTRAAFLYNTDRPAYEAEVQRTLPSLTEASARATSQNWVTLS